MDIISKSPSNEVWSKIWKLSVPAKIKTFFGELANVVTIVDNLIRRRVEVHPYCTICNASPETTYHVLVDCPFAKHYWMIALVWFCWMFC